MNNTLPLDIIDAMTKTQDIPHFSWQLAILINEILG